jgi:hypothetical protein
MRGIRIIASQTINVVEKASKFRVIDPGLLDKLELPTNIGAQSNEVELPFFFRSLVEWWSITSTASKQAMIVDDLLGSG